MKKTFRIEMLLLAVVLLLGYLTACQTEEQKAEFEESVHETLAGGWVYYDETYNARYTYILNYGIIEQAVVVTDESGVQHDMSLGDSLSVRYRPIATDEIEIYSTVGGKDIVSGTIKFQKKDDNTLILDGVTYIRYEEWIKTHE